MLPIVFIWHCVTFVTCRCPLICMHVHPVVAVKALPATSGVRMIHECVQEQSQTWTGLDREIFLWSLYSMRCVYGSTSGVKHCGAHEYLAGVTWTAWARQDTVKVTWVTYWSTLFSFQENGNMLDFSLRNRLIMAPFAWGCCLFALSVLATLTIFSPRSFKIMTFWKLRWLKTFGMKTCQSGADGNPDIRLRNTALVNRCSKMGEAGSTCTQGCCYCCLNWKVDFRHLTDESQSKKPATSETCCSA